MLFRTGMQGRNLAFTGRTLSNLNRILKLQNDGCHDMLQAIMSQHSRQNSRQFVLTVHHTIYFLRFC
jgi:hypothetical protein